MTVISVIIPARNEQESLAPLVAELTSAVRREQPGVEIAAEVIIVDDCSTDDTWARIVALSSQRPDGPSAPVPVRGLRLARHLGKSAALSAGLAAAQGELLVTIDADLQDDPAELQRLLARIDDGCDLATGWKQRRQDGWRRRLSSALFNVAVSLLTGVWLSDHNCGFKAFKRRVLPALRLERGTHRYLAVMAAAGGFRVGQTPVHHRPRRFGRSRYGWRRVPESIADLARIIVWTRGMRRPAPAPPAPAAPPIVERCGFELESATNS
ncbi:MAG: Undecaprenyl-phosphate 4-deoxy-4-formamido-L-arabinose transferase [Phycisphaerae bacterium]|nr:Undecaprenyl-phosphate 4-deoxy-4-formamido-L-arabinose transferase [Phycisphaerae bacterium]